MKYPCSSSILFDSPCQYDGVVDTDTQAYSSTKIGHDTYYYHYRDYAKDVKEGIFVSPKNKKHLCIHLLALKEKGREDAWINAVLLACGYKDA